MSARDRSLRIATNDYVFPPAVLKTLREHVTAKAGCLADVSDDVLTELLTTIFWAGLDTYEGEHHPIAVVFLGTSDREFVFPEGADSGGAPLYQWKVMRFQTPRPFVGAELVKLAVACSRRLSVAVNMRTDGTLVISGLICEGFNVDPDPFITIVASRPGCVSIRTGGDLLLGYERGSVLTGGEGVWFSTGPVRRALERMAREAGVDEETLPDYVRAVRSLVADMTAHGHGGILIVSDELQPLVAAATPYQMQPDSSLASLLRLAKRIGHSKRVESPQQVTSAVAFHVALRNAFLAEAERTTEDLGALTAIDGAVIVSCELALIAFGVVLPVNAHTSIVEANEREGQRSRLVDLGSRGTRHRASATYAADHPGTVVFVVSEDGNISCMYRSSSDEPTMLWRLGSASARS